MTDELYPEEWLWEAQYTDGSLLLQSEGHKFKEIEQERLGAFIMTCKDEKGNDTRAPIIIKWRQGLKLIHFYRVRHTIGSTHTQIRMVCFGYQEGSSKTIMVIMPDGGIVVTDNVDGIVVET